MEDTFKCSMRTSPIHPDIELWIYKPSRSYAELLTKDGYYITLENGERFPEPTIRIPREAIQSLIEEALALGFMKKQITADADVLKAKDAHLADLQKLVFKRR